MKRYIIISTLLMCILSMCIGSCVRQKSDAASAGSAGDSLYTRQAILLTYGSNPEEALAMIDSAISVGNLTACQADFLRATVFSKSLDAVRFDTVIVIGERLLQQPEVQGDLRFKCDVLEVLAYSARMLQDYELLLQYDTDQAEVCRQLGDEVDVLRIEAEIGMALIHIGGYDAGIMRIDSILSKLGQAKKFSNLDATILTLKRKINGLAEMSRFADIIPEAQRILSCLDDLEKNPATYREEKPRVPFDDNHLGNYINFYRTQAYSFLASAYANTGDETSARHYISLFNQSNHSPDVRSRAVIGSALCMLGDYDEMEKIYDEVEHTIYEEHGDTMTSDYALMIRDRAIAAQAQGRKDESIMLWRRYCDVSRCASERIFSGKAHLYAARFHAQEQQAELARKDAAIARQRLIVRSLGLLMVFVFCLATWFFYQKRLVSRRNRILAAQIAETVAEKEKNRMLKHELVNEVSDKSIPWSQLDDVHLFMSISKKIEEGCLFLDPTFDRQSLITLTGLSKERIGSAFTRGGNYSSLSAFINGLRLEYASRLLVDRPNLSIEQVALQCGFSSRKYFSEKFKELFGMQPTEFRQARLSQS